MRDEFYFPSKDGNTEIHTVEWKPDGEVRAVLQICHGMVEYIKRYDEFAQFLCEKGYYVVGNDHLGHGKSVQSKSEYGFFDKRYGNACVLGDIHTLRQRTAKKYPDVPYFMMGHSMGSSLLRQYIQMYGNGLAGAVLMGVVTDHSRASLLFVKRLCRLMAAVRGWHYRSRIVDELVRNPCGLDNQRQRAPGGLCGRSAVLIHVYGQCILQHDGRDAGDAEEGKHTHDSERTSGALCRRSGRPGREFWKRCAESF